MAEQNPPSVCHIVTFGLTGVGKSWCGNRLIAAGQARFEEGDGDDSVTEVIASRLAFNGDTISDVPGYLDSKGRDSQHAAKFVDFVKGKWIRAIIFVYSRRTDAFMLGAADAFKDSDLQNNFIFVKNQERNAPAVEEDTLKDCPRIFIRNDQVNFDVLKNHIARKQPVKVTHLIVPPSLFKEPLTIVREEKVDVYVEDREMSVVVKMSKDVQVPVEKSEWRGHLRSRRYYTEYEQRTEHYDEVVKKWHYVYNRYLYKYAIRFDGKVDICSKEFLETYSIEIENNEQ